MDRGSHEGKSIRYYAAAIALAGTILVFDISLPLGVAGGVPYVAVILLGIWFPYRSHVLVTALLCSLLVAVGYWQSPAGGIDWVVLSNRGLALFVIWVTTVLVVLRKAADQATEESRALLESTYAAMGDALFVIDPQSRCIISCNASLERMFGYSVDEVLGWLDEEGLDFVSASPSITFAPEGALFEAQSRGWRLEHWLAQLSWLGRAADGGLWVTVARKR